MTDQPPIDQPHIDVDAYVSGDLGPEELAAARRHLAGCAACAEDADSVSEVTAMLGRVPEEFLLDGPPDDAEFLVRATTRRLAAEREADRRRRTGRRTLLVAAAGAVVTGGLGWALGRRSGEETGEALEASRPSTSPTGPAPVFAQQTDGTSGARITLRLTPADGWVRLNAAVTGIPAGQRCSLVVLTRDGEEVLAGGWLVSETGAAEGVTLDGSALVAPDDVAAVAVRNDTGTTFVEVDV
jgi:anti-sigma factor RsiW